MPVAVNPLRAAEQREILHIVGHEKAEDAADLVDALARALRDRVFVSSQVDVVAGTAGQQVGAACAVQGVVSGAAGQSVDAGITDDLVVEAIAVDLDAARGHHRDMLDIGRGDRQVDRDQCLDSVDPLSRQLLDLVGEVDDDVSIVAEAADQRVRAAAAVELVVSGEAFEPVVANAAVYPVVGGVAGAVDVAALEAEFSKLAARMVVRLVTTLSMPSPAFSEI